MAMKSTQAMRDRIRDLITEPQDDYDRAVECVLDDMDAAYKALEDISAMDPKGIRADDLGRAARIAAAALR